MFVLKAVYFAAVSAYDQVIYDLYIKQLAGIYNSFCDLNIIIAWLNYSARDGCAPALLLMHSAL